MDVINKIKQCSDDKKLYNYLYKLRSNRVNNEELMKVNGITVLSTLLNQRIKLKIDEENRKIIEVLLSLLGNFIFCIGEKAALQAINSSISETVISIVNNINDPSVQSKACRIIGNLAQFKDPANNLQSFDVALCLSNCIVDDANNQVLIMAIRAIRQMYNLKRFRHQILNYGTILKIIMCLYRIHKVDDEAMCDSEKKSDLFMLKRNNQPERVISKDKLEKMIKREMDEQVELSFKYYPIEDKKKKIEFKSRVDQKDIVNGTLKFILTVTNTSLSQVARSIYADGFGIKILTFLTSVMEFRSMALKILANFAYNTKTQDYLKRCKVIEEICEMLVNNSKSLAANEQKYALAIVCLSLDQDACSRLKVRHSGVFKILLEIAKSTKSEEELNLLIFAFYQFRFDEDGLEELTRLNLVNVLIKILSEINLEVDHVSNNNPSIEDDKFVRKISFTDVLNHTLKYPKYENYRPSSPILSSSSPGSSNSQMSPTTSGYSPFNSPIRCYNDYDSDSNQYSPVCSDNEEDLNRIEAKVDEIIEQKRSEVKVVRAIKKKIKEPLSKKIKMMEKKEEKSLKLNKIEDDEEEEEVIEKPDFDILEFIYKNDEIGVSEKISPKKRKSEKKSSKKSSKLIKNLTETQNVTEDSLDANDEKNSNKKSENFPQTLEDIEKEKQEFIVMLIWRVSLKYSNFPTFAQAQNLKTLINYCRIVRKPNGKIYQILQNVIKQSNNFVSIFLKQTFVFDLFALSKVYTDHENCYSCDKMKLISRELLLDFAKVGESGYGRGEIIDCLLSSSVEVKKELAVKIMFIITSTEMLNYLLFQHHCLDIVFDVIFANTDLSVIACEGFTIMAENLGIKLSSEDETLTNIIPDDFKLRENELIENSIKFILKDGEIEVDKAILMNSSEVFTSMLSSDFRESNCNEIKFPSYTVEGMKYFYQILIMQKEKRLKSVAPRVDNIEILLQSFELSNLYILSDLQQPLLNIIKIVINDRNVMTVFEWSLRYVNQELLISSICYFLCSKIDGKVKLRLFLEANSSLNYGKEWRKLIEDSIKMKCLEGDINAIRHFSMIKSGVN